MKKMRRIGGLISARLNAMRYCCEGRYWEDFWFLFVIFIILTGFGCIGIFTGWVHHIRFGYTLQYRPEEDVVVLGRISIMSLILGVCYGFLAFTAWSFMLKSSRPVSPKINQENTSE